MGSRFARGSGWSGARWQRANIDMSLSCIENVMATSFEVKHFATLPTASDPVSIEKPSSW